MVKPPNQEWNIAANAAQPPSKEPPSSTSTAKNENDGIGKEGDG